MPGPEQNSGPPPRWFIRWVHVSSLAVITLVQCHRQPVTMLMNYVTLIFCSGVKAARPPSSVEVPGRLMCLPNKTHRFHREGNTEFCRRRQNTLAIHLKSAWGECHIGQVGSRLDARCISLGETGELTVEACSGASYTWWLPPAWWTPDVAPAGHF